MVREQAHKASAHETLVLVPILREAVCWHGLLWVVTFDKEVHVICDNYATHKHEKVMAWQKRNPRFHFHFTPTSASWLNLVERFFRDLTDKSLKRGVFRNLEDLIKTIQGHIAAHNSDPKPFIWTATATDILEKVKRGRRKLLNMQSA